MLELDRARLGFKMKTVYFADRPYDVEGVDWVQFMNTKEKSEVQGFERRELSNGVFDLTKGTEQLWKSMHRNCRQDIRRSEKEDITIHINEDYPQFIRLNRMFRREKGIPRIFRYYLKPPLPDFCTLFTAKHLGEVEVGLLFINDDREMYAMLAASKRLEVTKEEAALIARANRRLWWEAIKWGSEHGYRLIDLGNFPAKGTDSEMEGVTEFKRHLGAEPMNCYFYRKLYSRKAKAVDKFRSGVGRLALR